MCITKPRSNSNRAVTLVDMTVAMAVSAIILTALLSFTVYSAKSFAAMENYVDLEQKSQNALDIMTRDIREAQFLIGYGTATLTNGATVTNVLTFQDSDNTPLTFQYTNDVLLRLKTNSVATLLTNVDFLTFQIFQRNPVAGTYETYPTATATNCKLVSVSWICSRSILGARLNTESVQTARIVIRKQ
jgi:Tfp pilus assembly protein PilW